MLITFGFNKFWVKTLNQIKLHALTLDS
jgi:hypothetical protein